MFSNAYHKLERAKEHIADLQSRFTAFQQTNAYTVSLDYDPNTGLAIINTKVSGDAPMTMAMVIGDCIHNLETALDHATWEIIGLDGGTQDRWTKFPTGKNKVDYDASCNGIKTPRQDTKDFFVNLGAYEGGPGWRLYSLHELDITDKHMIIVPVISTVTIGSISIKSPSFGSATIDGATLKPGVDGKFSLGDLGAHARLKIDEEKKPTLDIRFGEVGGLVHRPVFGVMADYVEAVEGCLRDFSEFVKNRK
ncbi:MAG: hypothetical protein GC166_04840 [Alphaproteobacteria bacterium]|nr:hypothetical protein [Alphaproteobacteria bacterium]